jgi:precorrin-2/cobalt-factor-2 C20-methyltransferase
MSGTQTSGRLYGVGLGPGDPDLVTVKAVKAIEGAAVVAWFCKKGRRGHARTIADGWMKPGVTELPLVYPVTVEIPFEDTAYVDSLSGFYAQAAEILAGHLAQGRDVALLCEGDPFFYGSYMHMHERLKDRFPITVCPGVTGMSGCWTAAVQPMTWGDDVLTVLPGTLPAPTLAERLDGCDAAVIMKLGRNLPKVRAVLAQAGLVDRAIYVERGTMADEVVMRLADKTDDQAPYFSMILVPGRGRRP